MPFRVSGKNITIGEALRGRVNARIAEATAKYFDGGYSGHVTIGKDGFGFRTECLVHLDSGIVLEAEAIAGGRLCQRRFGGGTHRKRLRRYKRRLKDRQAVRRDDHALEQGGVDAPSYVIAAPDENTDEEVTEFNPVIIAESTTTLQRMSVSEARSTSPAPRWWCSGTLDMVA
jgi:putative sigma-54 modulation protein